MKIEARIIMELMGRPENHVKETLQTLTLRLGSESGIKIIDKKQFDPKKIEGSETLFSAFAEIELEAESMEKLLLVTYLYSPSNLEIISPENLKISNADLNLFFNSLLDRVHSHGAVLKKAIGERDILLRQMEYLKQNLGDKVTDLLKKKESINPQEKKKTKKKTK